MSFNYILFSFEDWKEIERLSRRNDMKDILSKKENGADIPFNIVRKNGESILCQSGIKDWKEEMTYLQQQLSPSQKCCRDSIDTVQRKRDKRILREKESKQKRVDKQR